MIPHAGTNDERGRGAWGLGHGMRVLPHQSSEGVGKVLPVSARFIPGSKLHAFYFDLTMSAYSKDLCVVTLDASAKLGAVKRRVLNAFLEGIYCFRFVLKHGRRSFEDRVALPKDADDACALEMAEHQFQRFLNTVVRR